MFSPVPDFPPVHPGRRKADRRGDRDGDLDRGSVRSSRSDRAAVPARSRSAPDDVSLRLRHGDGGIEQLRRMRNIVRLGHVTAIEPDRIVLEQGTIDTGPGTLYVDCTADGLEQRPVLPVFDRQRITLQSVRRCQQVFSAAFIAHVEASYRDDGEKNELCVPVQHPDNDRDWLRALIDTNRNHLRWAQDGSLQAWLDNARLDGYHHWRDRWPSTPAEQAKALQAMQRSVGAMNGKLERIPSRGAGRQTKHMKGKQR